MTTDSGSDRLATLDFTLLADPGGGETSYVRRIKLFEGDPEPREVQISPAMYGRVELDLGDGRIVSVGYSPPKVHPEAQRWEEISPVSRRVTRLGGV
jgi:hypothetical protein